MESQPTPVSGQRTETVLPVSVPRIPPSVKAQVIALHIAGESNRSISKRLGVGKDTVPRIIAEGLAGKDTSHSPVDRAMALAGLTHESVSAKLAELMNANEVKRAQFEGHFTDSAVDPDNAVRFRAVEATAKILGMFPSESTTAQAALYVKLPMNTLTPGHAPSCLCDQCAKAWDSYAITVESGTDTDK